MKYIYNKIIVGPYWKNILGRKKKLFQESGNSLDKFYNNINYLNSPHYSSINMGKQTQRNGFPINHNLRQRFEVKFVPVNDKNRSMILKKVSIRHLISKSPFSRDNPKYRLKKIVKNNKKKSFFTNYKPEIDKNLSFEKCKSIPDFNKCLSRKYLEKIERKKIIKSNQIYCPNYNSIKERIKMFVFYNKNKKKNDKYKEIKRNGFFNLSDNFKKKL